MPSARPAPTGRRRRPKVGLVSLGCAKALVDTERVVTRLRAEGYEVAQDYAAADVVVVNTCGFLISAREESLAAIGEAEAAGFHVDDIRVSRARLYVNGYLNRSFDVKKRYRDLLAFYQKHGLKPEADWMEKRLKELD